MANRPIDIVQMKSDLFLEMLEVYINSILYLREVYPAAIFRKRRVYSTTAFISIFPPLNKYLLNTLKTAQALKAENKLYQVELIIYQKEFDLFGTPEDEEVLERYVFRMENDENLGSNQEDLELYILKFEDQLRRGLIDLDGTAKHLKRLDPQTVGFRIHLETTQAAYVDIVNKENTKSESFSWVAEREDKYETSTKWKLQPVLNDGPFSVLLFKTNKSF